MHVASAEERRIGRYVLLDQLGRGAMGIVYRAQDPLINRTVAVKLLDIPQTLSPEQAAVVHERFVREAQAAGALDHPSIVRIFDVGEDEESGQLYIVMEHIPGPSLDQLVEERRLDHREAVDLVGRIASGLDAAHARGIIHRDIKPANILFTEEKVPKIADFGIARVASSHLTQDVRDLGTPIYMSPEQVLGNPLDGRADLFSLGVLTYQLLTGRPPFEGKEAVSVAYQIVHQAALPASSIATDLPRAVDRVLERILAKAPEDRYACGREFHEALASALLQNGGIASRWRPGRIGAALAAAARWSARRRLLAGAVVLALSVIAILLLRGSGAEGSATAPARAVPVAGTEAPTTTFPAPLPAEVKTSSMQAPPAAVEKPVAIAPKPVEKQASPRSRLLASADRPTPSPPPAPTPVAVAPPSPAPVAEAPPIKAASPDSSVTLSLGHWIGRGTLIVWLDGQQILSEEFSKGKLTLFQRASWDAIPIRSGAHRLSAKVVDAKGRQYLSEPLAVDVAPGRNLVMRIAFKDDALVWKRKGTAEDREDEPESAPAP